MFGNLSYTNKDITAIREEIINFIKENNEDWADFNESSIQMQYTEMLAGVADMLCYYLDSQALETFLTTARQKKNINSILRTINYTYETVGPSMGVVVFTRTPHERGTDGEPIYINERYFFPKYLKLWTNDRIEFLTTEARSMPDDDLTIAIPVIQGTLMDVVFPMDTVRESFKLQIADHPVPLQYVEIQNDGFEKVDDAFVLTKGGPYYSVHNDSYDNVYILFTYDWKKYLPEEESLEVIYVDTLGKTGNVMSDTITNYGTGIKELDEEGQDEIIELKVTNPNATYGGFSDVDIRKHQANAMNWLMTHDTIVLLSDFETLVRKESWVLDCVCFDWRKDDTIVQYPYQLKAWVVAYEGPAVASNMLLALTKRLQEKTVIMNTVEILNADYYSLELEVYLKIQGNNETTKELIRQKVEDKVKSWFSWNSFLEGDPDTKLQFGLAIMYNKTCYDIAGLASAISDVQLSIDGDLYLKKTQFLYCTTVKVEIV